MKKYYLVILIAFCSQALFAQTKKATPAKPAATTLAAYVFEDYIFENYNGTKKFNEELQRKQEGFQTEYNKIALEYQTANLKYQESLRDLEKATTESLTAALKQVQEIKAAADEYQRQSEKQLQEMMGESIMKLKGEVKAGVEKVAAEKKIPFVFTRFKTDTPMNFSRTVLYASSNAPDLSDEVIKVLNAVK